MGLTNLSTKRQRIAELARTKSGVALSTLHHVLDLEWVREAYPLTRKDGAPGIDGVTAAEYAQNLEANLLDLLERIKSGRYQAPPVRRVYIPKGDGAKSLRPLASVEVERVTASASLPAQRRCAVDQKCSSKNGSFARNQPRLRKQDCGQPDHAKNITKEVRQYHARATPGGLSSIE